MNRRIRERKAYWIGGTAAALAGVALVRLAAPELAGLPGWAVLTAGHLLVVAGITALACATRRKPSEAFVTVGKDGRPIAPQQARRHPDGDRRRSTTV